MKCGECPVATTNPKDKTDCYFCPFDKVNAFHSLHDCSHLSELVEKMAELLKKKAKYDPEMPCNKKECDAQTRASCCGCPEQLEYERNKKRKG